MKHPIGISVTQQSQNFGAKLITLMSKLALFVKSADVGQICLCRDGVSIGVKKDSLDLFSEYGDNGDRMMIKKKEKREALRKEVKI